MRRGEVRDLVTTWLSWRLDLDIEERRHRIAERGGVDTRTLRDTPPGPCVPKGVEFTRRVDRLNRLGSVLDQMPDETRIALFLVYWPARGIPTRDLCELAGVSRTEFDALLRNGEQFIKKGLM